ncbi:hypothetical protein D6D01_07072 [Aureobasidium pullulans]|uniref:Xylanolytic transcriptional activator regulatory domain-containing protein n=1 Tax=Aureobasidium pullulans TaxID=5580 RepID=A0A4S9KU98_AURPU|nr:hypothetical protein D6D01_07072 [Aureobasidium pullulans]
MPGLTLEQTYPDVLTGIQGDFWLQDPVLDNAILESCMHSLDQSNTSPVDAPSDRVVSTSEHLGQDLPSIVCGLTGDMDPYLMRRYNFDSDDTFVFKRLAIRSVSKETHPVQFLVSAIQEAEDTNKEMIRTQIDDLISLDIGIRLISLFSKYVGPHIAVFISAIPSDPMQIEPSLLAAVYLLALPFAGNDDYLSVQIAYDLPDATKLWDLASTGVLQQLHQPNFSTLQTLILLLVAPPQKLLMPDYATKWSLVGIMVTVSQTLGLQHDPSHWDISPAKVQLRNRLSWSVKMIDVWYAAVLGRSCLVREDDWLVPEPRAGEVTASDSPKMLPTHLVHMYKLTSILHTTLTTFFSLRAIQALATDYQTTLQKAQVLMEELNRWNAIIAGIQSTAELNDLDPLGPMLLGGHVVKVLLFRAILRPFQERPGSPSTATSNDHRKIEARRLSRTGAKSCVASFTAFTSDLKSTWTHGFWPFWCALGWSTLCNLALLLYATAQDTEEAQECRLLLDRARQIVRLQSKSLDILRFPLLRIDSIFWKGLENVLTTDWQQL